MAILVPQFVITTIYYAGLMAASLFLMLMFGEVLKKREVREGIGMFVFLVLSLVGLSFILHNIIEWVKVLF